ncbi:replication initiation factor domain-containing protein, partial [Lactobacillus taiwanensis]|uniref:replication initiation factor domain-containing protein n=1 Tax=Lactobacillus taiwanensis TaxID=508451 RepID=UPI0021C312F7
MEFTVLDTSLKDVIDRIVDLPFEEFTPLEKGRFGYQNQLKWKAGHVYVMFTAIGDITENVRIKKETGVHVMITGQGCKQYSMNHSLETLLRFLSAQEKVNFSRIDLAIDDYQSKIINYDRIHQSAIDGHFTSRWSKWDEINSRQSSTGEFLGRTMYFGSQASDLFCRIYDKSLERKAKSEDDPKS